MKNIFKISIVSALLPLLTLSEETTKFPEVTVASAILPTTKADMDKSFELVPNFMEFWKLTTKSWTETRGILISNLLIKAKHEKLDYGSLELCLKKSNTPKKRAILPIAAFYTKEGNNAYWTICCVWEYPGRKDEKGNTLHLPFAHTMTYLFNAKTREQIGMETCR